MADESLAVVSAASSMAAPPAASMAAPPSAAPPLERGTLIWGKIRGFAWWPCEVRSVRATRKPLAEGETEHKIRIRFLHTKENAECGTVTGVRDYASNAAELSVVKKGMFKSNGLKAKFQAAVVEAAARHAAGAEPEGPWSDDDEVDEEDVQASLEDAKKYEGQWKSSGHPLIGKHIAVSARARVSQQPQPHLPASPHNTHTQFPTHPPAQVPTHTCPLPPPAAHVRPLRMVQEERQEEGLPRCHHPLASRPRGRPGHRRFPPARHARRW